MQRWVIALDAEVRCRLTKEHLELGTEIEDEDGRQLLVFRDRFVGLRVASTSGGRLLPYQQPLPAAV